MKIYWLDDFRSYDYAYNYTYDFEWDEEKNARNKAKHSVSFEEACTAFTDPKRIIADDTAHSTKDEQRLFCYARLPKGVITVRFTIRGSNIRIFGAGYWRDGRKKYEGRR